MVSKNLYVVKDRQGKTIYKTRRFHDLLKNIHVSRQQALDIINYPLEEDEITITKTETCPEYLWMIVTNDEYELPLAVFDSGLEMAKTLNLAQDSVYSAINHSKERGTFCRYRKVYVGDLE